MTKKMLKEILEKITPSQAERKKQKELADKTIKQIKDTSGKHLDVMLCGSNARDTHLRGDNDLDIFLLFPEKLSRKEFEEEGLRIGKRVFRGHKWEKAYSEHPYIKGNIQGVDIEIVPSYKIEKAELKQSAVDRSPFHNQYLQKKLKTKHKQEARLLKQFLKGIKAYGADTKAGSVPGYVVELLTLKYGSFEKTIQAITQWKQRETIDLAKYWKQEEAKKMFPDSALVIIDPVDKNRNVAAALTLNQFSRIIAAAKAYQKKPSKAYFFGKKEKPWKTKKLKEMLNKKELTAIKMGYPKKSLPDMVWGQIQRFAKKTEKQLQLKDFKVTRSEAWTDEENEIIIMLEVESTKLQKSMVKQGPFVTDDKNSKAFLEAHKRPIAGPRIEQGRWVIEIPRKHTSIEKLLKELVKKEKKTEKTILKKALNKGTKIMQEENIVTLYKKNKQFAVFLTSYLKGEEEFLGY